jgi:hypothetical protein
MAVLVGKKRQYPGASKKKFPAVPPFCGINPSVLEIFSVRKRNGIMKYVEV